MHAARVCIDVDYEDTIRSLQGPISHVASIRFESITVTDGDAVLPYPREALIDAIKKAQQTYKPYENFKACSDAFLTTKDLSLVRPLRLDAYTPRKESHHKAAEFAQDLVARLTDMPAYLTWLAMEPDAELVAAAAPAPEVDFSGL